MDLVREIVSLGRSARMNAKLKVRQPLAKVEVILADQTHRAWLEEYGGSGQGRVERQSRSSTRRKPISTSAIRCCPI